MRQKREEFILPKFYTIIPAEVRYNQELSPSAKLLYGDICLLSSKYGFCDASNEYLGFLYNVDDKTSSLWVNQLVKVGYLRVSILKNYKRKLYPQISHLKNKVGGSQEIQTGVSGNPEATPSGKPDNNNTSINTNINIIQEKEFNLEEEVKKLIEYQSGTSRWLSIIGLYIRVKGLDLTSKKQIEVIKKANKKIAEQIAEFDNEKIIEAFKKAQEMVDFTTKEPYDWKLSSVLYKLTK